MDLGSIPTVACDPADKEVLLCGCQVGKRGWLGIGVGPASRGVRSQYPLSLCLRGEDSCSPRLGTPGLEAGEGTGLGCPGPQGTLGGPRQQVWRLQLCPPSSRLAVKHHELFTRAQLSPEGG